MFPPAIGQQELLNYVYHVCMHVCARIHVHRGTHVCPRDQAHTCLMLCMHLSTELPLSSLFLYFQLPPHFHNYLGLYFSFLYISFNCLINIFFIRNYLVWN